MPTETILSEQDEKSRLQTNYANDLVRRQVIFENIKTDREGTQMSLGALNNVGNKRQVFHLNLITTVVCSKQDTGLH